MFGANWFSTFFCNPIDKQTNKGNLLGGGKDKNPKDKWKNMMTIPPSTGLEGSLNGLTLA